MKVWIRWMSPAGDLPFRVVGETVADTGPEAVAHVRSVYPTARVVRDLSDDCTRMTVKGRNVAYLEEVES